jgi:putative ABC transport system permease protein
MRTSDQLSYAGNSVRTRKGRAGLTTLGITIGIAAIVALLSLANGFQAAISNQFAKGFAANSLTVTAKTSAANEGFALNQSDAGVIQSLDPADIALAVPIYQFFPSSEKNATGTYEYSCNYTTPSGASYAATVIGVNFTEYSELYSAFEVNASDGGSIPFNEPGNESFVIGARVAQTDAGVTNFNVGDLLTLKFEYANLTTGPNIINNVTWPVCAIMPTIGGFSFGGPSDLDIFMQIDQAQAFFNTTSVSSIVVSLSEANPSTDLVTSITNLIENSTSFGSDVTVTSGTSILTTINSIFSIIEVFIGAIAGISLVVAGIGIMNIQIVAILERTREIGILKAMGAKDRTVLSVFLSETLFIGLIGAGLGILIGYLLAIVGGSVIGGAVAGGGGFGGIGGGAAVRTASSASLTITPVLTIPLVFEAVLFGVLVAVVFGLYPALRASRLKPVDALRFE